MNIETGKEENGMGKDSVSKDNTRPRRAAAIDAQWRNRILLDSRESRRGDVLGKPCP